MTQYSHWSTPCLVAAVAMLASGCVINGNKWTRPRDLEQSWLVNRTRILGIRAEPAEIAPGQRAELQALIGTGPEPESLIRIWVACEDSEGPCITGELGKLDPKNLDPKTLQTLGFVGVELGIPGEMAPTYTAPVDLLDDLEPEQRLEGLNVTVQLSALPAAALVGDDPAAEVDFNEIEAGYKLLPVSEATTPNNNPVLTGITVDDETSPSAEPVEVEAGATVVLTLGVDEAATIEEYEYLNSSGVVEDRVEEPYVTWFVSDGEMLDPLNLWPLFAGDWVAPEEPGVTGTWYAVVRDRRGGMAWATRTWTTIAR